MPPLVQSPDLVVKENRPPSVVEKVLILILSISILCAVSTKLVQLCVGRITSGRCKIVASTVCDILSYFAANENSKDEELEAIVQERLRELKVGQLRFLMQVTCLVLLPMTLTSLFKPGHLPLVNAPQQIGILSAQAICTLPCVRPDSVTPRTLDVFYVYLVIVCSLMVTPLMCCTGIATIPGFVVPHFYLVTLNAVRRAGTRREMLVTLVANVVFLACSDATRRQMEQEQDDVMFIWTATQATIILMVISLSCLFEAGLRKLVIQGFQLTQASDMYSAACGLLRSCYDVVVELDSLGCVEGDSQDLGSLLLRPDGNRTMHGVRLADLIVDEGEREHFLRRLADPKMKSVGLAENMHLSMRDGMGHTLRLETMWFDFKRVDGVRHFVVGIREFSDQPAPSCSGDRITGPTGFSLAGMRVEAEASTSSENSMSQSEALDFRALPEAMIVIDLTANDRPVRAVTAGFLAQVGQLPRNTPLSSFVKRSETLVAWLESAVNSAAHGMDLPEDYCASLRMPQRSVRACCRLVVTETESGTMVDVEHLVVLLYDILHVAFHSPANRSRHRCGSDSSTEGCRTPSSAIITAL